MRQLTPIGILLSLVLLILFPLIFGQLMVAALTKLHLTQGTAIYLVFAIIFGGLVNIPVKRIVRNDVMPSNPLAVYGMSGAVPQLTRTRRETIIAVNLGGCIIPTALALYELSHLLVIGAPVLSALGIVCAVNTLACYAVAQPVQGIGIVMPGFVSPLTAALLAMLLAPTEAPAVAFIAGVVGPLVGADLFHLKDITKNAVGVASIGGAGTFDGIVLSGIVAAYLA
ncbi:MAG: DUF1614 domain-containing protein [Alphaproteobacteria bacterium]|nr:DUF1614 domain-containing protein [Alphaproteobacteria bacterium]